MPTPAAVPAAPPTTAPASAHWPSRRGWVEHPARATIKPNPRHTNVTPHRLSFIESYPPTFRTIGSPDRSPASCICFRRAPETDFEKRSKIDPVSRNCQTRRRDLRAKLLKRLQHGSRGDRLELQSKMKGQYRRAGGGESRTLKTIGSLSADASLLLQCVVTVLFVVCRSCSICVSQPSACERDAE